MMKNFILMIAMSSTLIACDLKTTDSTDLKEKDLNSSVHVDAQPKKTGSAVKQPADDVKPKEIQLSKNGIGDILVNQTFSQDLFSEIKDSRIENCFYATSKHYPQFDLNIQIIADRVAVISTLNPQYVSDAGVKVGDTEDVIYKNHPNEKFEKVMNPYGDNKTQYSIFYWDDAKKQKGIRYDIEQKKVTEIYLGNENLELMEGCA